VLQSHRVHVWLANRTTEGGRRTRRRARRHTRAEAPTTTVGFNKLKYPVVSHACSIPTASTHEDEDTGSSPDYPHTHTPSTVLPLMSGCGGDKSGLCPHSHRNVISWVSKNLSFPNATLCRSTPRPHARAHGCVRRDEPRVQGGVGAQEPLHHGGGARGGAVQLSNAVDPELESTRLQPLNLHKVKIWFKSLRSNGSTRTATAW
jgi:hypothetical protein